MKIKRLYIGDFGILQNQTMEDIGPGLVVIGGPNRAGKSTFLNLLRYLGYGFPRKGNFPDPQNNYLVEGDIDHQGELYRLKIEGYAEPQINKIHGDGSVGPIKDIYNNLDAFSYQRIFTIAIDELKKLPGGLSDGDSDKLQSVLLGAGLNDLIQIPQIEEELKKEAVKIGGRLGNPSVSDFKPYYQQIKKGKRLREDALAQVDEYRQKKNHLSKLEREIKEETERYQRLEDKLINLDILKSNYIDYKEYQKLDMTLDSREIKDLLANFPAHKLSRAKQLLNDYLKLEQGYRQQLARFKEDIVSDDYHKMKEKLVNKKEKLRYYEQQLSGLQERVDNYLNRKESYLNQKNRLITEMERLNHNWQEFDHVLNIRTDEIELDRLNQDITRYTSLEREIDEERKKLDDLEEREEILKERLKGLARIRPDGELKKYFYLSLVFILVGGGISFFQATLAIIIGVVGVLGAGIYSISKYLRQNSLKERKEDLKVELETIDHRILEKLNDIERIQERLQVVEGRLDKYRSSLTLSHQASPTFIKDYLREVVDLQQKIIRWKEEGDSLDKKESLLKRELAGLADLLADLKGEQFDDLTGRIDDSNRLFKLVKENIDYLEPALELAGLENEKQALQGEIADLLGINLSGQMRAELEDFLEKGQQFNKYKDLAEDRERLRMGILQTLKTDQVKNSIESYFEDNKEDQEGLFQLFGKLFNQFHSQESVEQEYRQVTEKLNSLERELERLKERRQTVKDDIDRLSTTDNLTRAQQQIDRGRQGLRPLAEKYAIYRAAGYILSKVRQNYVNKMKDEMLEEASQTLARITDGDYQQILPPDNLIEADFKTVLKNGQTQKTTDKLSRGTREQLFMSVRVSRIKDIDPPLPVIVDDSFVNFDPKHLAKTVELLAELSRTHQIFLLTCHPHLLEHIRRQQIDEVQYWGLDRGRFFQADKKELNSLLDLST